MGVSTAMLNRLMAMPRTTRGNYYIAAIVVVTAIALNFAVPWPIEGYWRGRSLTDKHGCHAHSFLEFAEGNVWFYHGNDPKYLCMKYRKTGWNRYDLTDPHTTRQHKSTIVIYGWLLFRWDDEIEGAYWGYRDYQFLDARKTSQLVAERRNASNAGKTPPTSATKRNDPPKAASPSPRNGKSGN